MAAAVDPLDELACRLEQNRAQVSSGVPHAPIAQFLAGFVEAQHAAGDRARLAETVGQLAKLEAELAQGARAKARLKQTCADSLSALETLQRRRHALPGGEEASSPIHTGVTVHHFSPVACTRSRGGRGDAAGGGARAPSEPLSTARVRVNPKFAWDEARLRPRARHRGARAAATARIALRETHDGRRAGCRCATATRRAGRGEARARVPAPRAIDEPARRVCGDGPAGRVEARVVGGALVVRRQREQGDARGRRGERG